MIARSLMKDEEDQVRSAPMYKQCQPLKKRRYRGRRGSRILRKLREQAGAESFKAFAKPPSWRKSTERNRQLEAEKLRAAGFSKGCFSKRPWRSSGGAHHSNPIAKKPRWCPSGGFGGESSIADRPSQSFIADWPSQSTCQIDPQQCQAISVTRMNLPGELYQEQVQKPSALTHSVVQKLTALPHNGQASFQESCVPTRKEHRMVQDPAALDHLEQPYNHFFVQNSSWSCQWNYGKVQETDPSTNSEHRAAQKSSNSIHQEQILVQKSSISTQMAHSLAQNSSALTTEEQGLSQEISHERYKKRRREHAASQKWGSPFQLKKRKRHMCWIRNSSTVTSDQKSGSQPSKDMIMMSGESTQMEQMSVHNRSFSSHQEQTVVLNSSISSHGKQPLARNSSSSGHEEQAVTEKLGPPDYMEHKMQTSGASAHHKPITSIHCELKLVKQSSEEHKMQILVASTHPKPIICTHPELKLVKKSIKGHKMQTSGASSHQKPITSTHHELELVKKSSRLIRQEHLLDQGHSSKQQALEHATVGSIPNIEDPDEEHCAGHNSAPISQQHPVAKGLGPIHRWLVPPIHKDGFLDQESGIPTCFKRPLVEKRSATTHLECVAAFELGPSTYKKHQMGISDASTKEQATGQKTSIRSHKDATGQRLDTQKKSLVQEHATGQKASIRSDEDFSGGTLDAQKKSLVQEHATRQKTSIRSQEDFTGGRLDTQKKSLVHTGQKTSFRNVQRSAAPSRNEHAPLLSAHKEPAADQESGPSIHRELPPIQKSDSLIHQKHGTVQKSDSLPRKQLAMQKPSASDHRKPPNVQKSCRVGEKADQHHAPHVSASKEHAHAQMSIDPEHDVDQNSGSSNRKDHVLAQPSSSSPIQEQAVVQMSEAGVNKDHGLVQNSGAPARGDNDLFQISSGSTNLVEIPLLRLIDLILEKNEVPKSEDSICLTCGDVGYRELLVYCSNCKSSAQHRYCMDGFVAMEEEELTWICEDCVGRFPELKFLNDNRSESIRKALLQKQSSSAVNITSNDREKPRKDPSSQEMINDSEFEVGGCSNLNDFAMEDMGNQNSPTSYEDSSGPFSERGEDCINGDIHFGKRRRRVIIYESEEESNNDLSSSDPSKECHDCSTPITCDRAPESNSYIKAQPIFEPIWRGCFQICGHSYGMLSGHLSSKACLKVYEAAKLLKRVTGVEMLPRIDAWPKTFERSPPSDDNIGLYFFPEKFCDERIFGKLVNEINCQDLALKVILDEMELLIFSSLLLQHSTRFCGKYYLWGVFRARQRPVS